MRDETKARIIAGIIGASVLAFILVRLYNL